MCVCVWSFDCFVFAYHRYFRLERSLKGFDSGNNNVPYCGKTIILYSNNCLFAHIRFVIKCIKAVVGYVRLLKGYVKLYGVDRV